MSGIWICRISLAVILPANYLTGVSIWAYDAAETAALQETQFEVATGEELAALQSRASERLQQKLISLLSLIPAEFLELFE